MITILHGGGGPLGTPKSDYVICARPLIIINILIITAKAHWARICRSSSQGVMLSQKMESRWKNNLWSLVTQELMVSGFFRKYFFRSFTPPFLSQDFFSFPSLYETSLNDHEPSIANDLRETHTKWVLKKAEFVSCRYFPFTRSSGTTTYWCCNSSSSTLKISRPQKVTTSIILNHLKWW